MSLRIKESMLTAAIILIALYLFIGAVAWFYSDSVIFQPQAIDFSDKSHIYDLRTPGGEKIRAKFFENEAAEFTILFSHGNAEDIHTSTPFFKELSRAGFNVFAYDYRGYGVSEGHPSEKNTYEDIETAYDFLVDEKKIAPAKIILHGRSLGGAVAVDLAARRKCGGLIVESSFVSAFRVMTGIPLFPFDKFESLKKIGKVTCPVLVIHGTNDRLIPFWHGAKLFDDSNDPKSIYPVANAGHNDVRAVAGKKYFDEIVYFSSRLGS